MTKRRRKGPSRQARDQRLFSRCVSWMWESEIDPTSGVHTLHSYRKAMMFGWTALTDTALVDNLIRRPRNWVVCARALCRAPDGTEWMSHADLTLVSTRLSDVEGAYDLLRKEALLGDQTRHVVDCGWVAITWLGEDPNLADPHWAYYGTEMSPARPLRGDAMTDLRREQWQAYNKTREDEHEGVGTGTAGL